MRLKHVSISNDRESLTKLSFSCMDGISETLLGNRLNFIDNYFSTRLIFKCFVFSLCTLDLIRNIAVNSTV